MAAPAPNITVRDAETLMDAYAYMLATDDRTSIVTWILGDVGMGKPARVPFGYISMISDTVAWATAQGGVGGLAAGGNRGLDDRLVPVVLTICVENHRFVTPQTGTPPDNSPFSPPNNQGFAIPYQEQPGWRRTLQIVQAVEQVLRSPVSNVVVLGAATDTRLTESRPVLQEINNELYRAVKITIQTQQRRRRGD